MTGRDAIENRTDQLIEKATNEIVLVIGHASLLTEDLVETLNEVDDEHDLIIGTLTEPLQDQVQAAVPDATTFVSGLEWLHGEHTTEDDTAIGRLLLIDRSTILVSSIMPDTKRTSYLRRRVQKWPRRDRSAAHGPGLIPARDPQ